MRDIDDRGDMDDKGDMGDRADKRVIGLHSAHIAHS